MTDPADIRAEGRRLLAEATDGPWHQAAAAAWSGTNEDPDLVADCPLYADAIAIVWLRNHADALLADPAPEGLSGDEARALGWAVNVAFPNKEMTRRELEAAIRRLSASTETGEGGDDG